VHNTESSVTAALPRPVCTPHPFSTAGTVEKTREQRVHLMMPCSSLSLDFQLLLHSLIKRRY
jgi:hypothetical protein